jgi:hypothetical protein
MKRLSLVALALLLFAVCSTTVRAANREIKFYLSEEFDIVRDPTDFRAANLATLAGRLSTYVYHMNQILAKNTDMQLIYNPASTVFVTQQEAYSQPDYQGAESPPANFHFAVYIPNLPDSPPFGGSAYRVAADEFAGFMTQDGFSGGWPAIFTPEDRSNHRLESSHGRQRLRWGLSQVQLRRQQSRVVQSSAPGLFAGEKLQGDGHLEGSIR